MNAQIFFFFRFSLELSSYLYIWISTLWEKRTIWSIDSFIFRRFIGYFGKDWANSNWDRNNYEAWSLPNTGSVNREPFRTVSQLNFAIDEGSQRKVVGLHLVSALQKRESISAFNFLIDSLPLVLSAGGLILPRKWQGGEREKTAKR